MPSSPRAYLVVGGADGRKISVPELGVSRDLSSNELQCLGGEGGHGFSGPGRDVETKLLAGAGKSEFLNGNARLVDDPEGLWVGGV